MLPRRSDHSALNAQPVSAYYHADGNGNITCMVDKQNHAVARYIYDPFGNIASSQGPLAEDNLYRFSSKEFHPQSGLVYYLYRYYEPNLQRWVNRDPINELGFDIYNYPRSARSSYYGHSYSFLNNAPIALIDPFGLFKWGKTCKQTDIDKMKKQFADRCKKAKENDCFKCLGKGQQAMNSACDNKDGEGPEVDCADESNSRCIASASNENPCGYTDPRGAKTIHLCMNQTSGGCGDQGCTLLHEAAHSVGGAGGDVGKTGTAYDVESCAGCK